jgi:hypothetical protein
MGESTGFRILLLLHLLCVIGGFGAVAYNGLYLALGRQQKVGAGPVLAANTQVSSLGELLIYGAALFGIAAAGSSHGADKFSQAWLIAALALYVVLLGILHGWIRPRRRRYDNVTVALAAATRTAPQAQAPDIAELAHLDRQIQAGWGVFNIIVVATLVLMVFRPGGS